MLRASLLAASLLFLATGARADDVVVLKDGTTLHGAVREMAPNQSVTIVLADGQLRTVEWKDVDRVDIDRPKANPAPVASGTTMVHIDGPPGLTLQMLDARGTENAWAEVCTDACDRELSSEGLYRIAGAGVRTSHVFRIEKERAKLQVTTASSVGHTGGLVVTIAGGVLLLNGISFFVVAAIDQHVITQDSYNTFLIVGAVLSGIGGAALITGGLLLANNLRTTVTGATTVRIPAWRELPTHPSSRFAAITFPVLSGSF